MTTTRREQVLAAVATQLDTIADLTVLRDPQFDPNSQALPAAVIGDAGHVLADVQSSGGDRFVLSVEIVLLLAADSAPGTAADAVYRDVTGALLPVPYFGASGLIDHVAEIELGPLVTDTAEYGFVHQTLEVAIEFETDEFDRTAAPS